MGTTVPDPPTLHTSTDAGGPLALVNMVIGGRHSALHLRYHSCLWPEHLDSRGPGTADGTCGPPSSTERPTHKAEGGAPADCSEILCFFPTRSAEGGKLGYKGGGEGGAGRKTPLFLGVWLLVVQPYYRKDENPGEYVQHKLGLMFLEKVNKRI